MDYNFEICLKKIAALGTNFLLTYEFEFGRRWHSVALPHEQLHVSTPDLQHQNFFAADRKAMLSLGKQVSRILEKIAAL